MKKGHEQNIAEVLAGMKAFEQAKAQERKELVQHVRDRAVVLIERMVAILAKV